MKREIFLSLFHDDRKDIRWENRWNHKSGIKAPLELFSAGSNETFFFIFRLYFILSNLISFISLHSTQTRDANFLIIYLFTLYIHACSYKHLSPSLKVVCRHNMWRATSNMKNSILPWPPYIIVLIDEVLLLVLEILIDHHVTIGDDCRCVMNRFVCWIRAVGRIIVGLDF